MGEIENKGEKAIEYAKELIDLYAYGASLKFGEDENEMLKTLLMIIEGKDCVIETQAHNEEVLMNYFERNTCLHCGKGKPAYCEDCYQELIGMNAKLQVCTDKEWQHCRVEKMGCEGCHYDKKEGDI